MNNRKGFSLIETLVAISIMSLLSGVLIIYNRGSEKQLLLFRDQAKIINAILKAKSLALNTYSKEGSPCAYGVHFEKNPATGEWEFRIFKDLDASGTTADCSTADNKYLSDSPFASAENLNPPLIEKLSANLKIQEPLQLTDIVFIAPEPTIVITPNPAPKTEAIIEIITSDGTSKKIKVNTFGQVSSY